MDDQPEVKPSVVQGQPEQRVQVLPRAMSGLEEFIRRKAELCGSGFQMLDEKLNATEDTLCTQP